VLSTSLLLVVIKYFALEQRFIELHGKDSVINLFINLPFEHKHVTKI